MSSKHPITQHRTQVYFPDYLYKAVKERAKKNDSSIAEVIRKAVEKELARKMHINAKEREKAWKEFMKAGEIAGSGLGDLSRNHDKYFDAFLIGKRRRKRSSK